MTVGGCELTWNAGRLPVQAMARMSQPRPVRLSEIMPKPLLAKQEQALEVSRAHQFTLYGGARGGAKSHVARWYALDSLLRLTAALKQAGICVGVFCEDYPTLRDRQIGRMAAEFPEWLGEVRQSTVHGLGFHVHKLYGSGVIKLRNLMSARAKGTKHIGAEYAMMVIEELTTIPEETFKLLIGSLRWPGVQQPRLFATTNPGGIGHAWVKRYWIDRDFPPEMADIAGEYAFVQALPADNPYLPDEYWRMLNSLPDHLRKAWVEGLWDIFAGQFYSAWRADKHVIGPFEIPRHWRLSASIDYGFNPQSEADKPFRYLLFAADTEGHAYLVHEIAAAEWNVARQKAEIAAVEARFAQGVEYRVGCPSMFTSEEHRGPTIAERYARPSEAVGAADIPEDAAAEVQELMRTGGASLPVTACDPDRISGYEEGRRALQTAPDGRPWFMVFATCRQFVTDLPLIVYDERNPMMIDERCQHHGEEAWRHWLMSRPGRARVVEERPHVDSLAAMYARVRRGKRF